MTDPAFDPRHDARFQRGYQPGDEGRVPVPDAAPSAARAASAPRAGAGVAAEAEAQSELLADILGQLAALSETGPTGTPAPTVASELVEALPVAPGAGPRLARRRNPFIIGLWVLGPLLAVGGAWLQMQAMSPTRSYLGLDAAGEQFDMAFRQVLWSLTPSMMAAGLTTILGLLFWHAWQWRAGRH